MGVGLLYHSTTLSSLSHSLFKQIENIELKPGGADIDVTESNKKEYVSLLMKWRFEDRICKQMEALKKVSNCKLCTKLIIALQINQVNPFISPSLTPLLLRALLT